MVAQLGLRRLVYDDRMSSHGLVLGGGEGFGMESISGGMESVYM